MSSNWLLCSTSPPTQVSSVQHWEELSLTLAHQEEPGDQRTLQTFSYSFLLSHFLVRAQLTLQGAWGSLYFIIIFKINLFIYLFIFGCIGSLLAASGGYSSLWCTGFSLGGFSLRSTGSRRTGFSSCGPWALEHRLSCSAACGIFLDQGSNPCPLHSQVDS